MDLFDSWISECSAALHLEVAEIRVEIRPRSKQRARTNWSTPPKTREWEEIVRSTAAGIMKGRPAIDFPVAARFILGVSHYVKGDTDNLEKIIWDALQPVVLTDDKFIRGYVEKAEKAVPIGEEFVWVRFYARRAVDYSNYKKQWVEVEDLGF